MEIGNRAVISIDITEKQFGALFGILLNAVFFFSAAYLMSMSSNQQEATKTPPPEEVIQIQLSKYENRMKIKTTRPQSASSSNRLVQNKGALATLDSLISMVKNAKPKTQELATRKDFSNLAKSLTGSQKIDGMMKDVKLSDNLIQELNKNHKKDEGLSDKILNQAKIVMANNISYFKMCYDKLLLTDGSIDGALPTTFDLDKSGTVRSVSFGGSINKKASSKELNKCFVNVGKQMKFPKEIAGQSLKYTFNLQR